MSEGETLAKLLEQRIKCIRKTASKGLCGSGSRGTFKIITNLFKLLYGEKIIYNRCLMLKWAVHLTGEQTKRRTDEQTTNATFLASDCG